ncbi:MAG: metallophosphoesterase [Anaerolineae bacterium]|nr:metallophosphoesterase [Anaerolineae bacterium]
MRIVVTSDTHYHPRWHVVLTDFVKRIAALNPDCLIIAGDVGERVEGFMAMLKLFQLVDCPRLLLSGNHDLWSRGGYDSEKLFTEVLPELAHQHGTVWLETENWVYDGIGICGTNGWYDYSGRDPSIALTASQYFAQKRMVMADGEFINWLWNDVEVARAMGDAFSQRLRWLDEDEGVRQVIVATHVPCFTEAIERRPGDFTWNLTNAYFYNLTLGQRITASNKVTHVFSGHTHIGKHSKIFTDAQTIEMRVIPADYGKPAYALIDL